MFAKELEKSVILVDNNYHASTSKSDSENLQYKPRYSQIQSFNKIPEIFLRADMFNVYNSPTLLANQSISFLHFNQSEESGRNIRTKDDKQPLPRENYCLFPPPLSSPEKKLFSQKLK